MSNYTINVLKEEFNPPEKTVTEDRDIWYGGSDISTIKGENPNKSVNELLAEKCGEIEPKPITKFTQAIFDFGNKIEEENRPKGFEACCRWVEVEYKGYKLKLRANVDGITKDYTRLVEIKTHGDSVDIEEKVNKEYTNQGNFYNLCFPEIEETYYYCFERLNNKKGKYPKYLKGDNKVFKSKQPSKKDFIDILDSLVDFEKAKQSKLKLKADIKNKIEEYAIRQGFIKELEELNKEIKKELIPIFQTIKTFNQDNDVHKLSVNYIKPFEVTGFDGDKFKEENPELYQKYIKKTTRKDTIKVNFENKTEKRNK